MILSLFFFNQFASLRPSFQISSRRFLSAFGSVRSVRGWKNYFVIAYYALQKFDVKQSWRKEAMRTSPSAHRVPYARALHGRPGTKASFANVSYLFHRVYTLDWLVSIGAWNISVAMMCLGILNRAVSFLLISFSQKTIFSSSLASVS